MTQWITSDAKAARVLFFKIVNKYKKISKPLTMQALVTCNTMKNTTKSKFNVAEITNHGNGGGTKVKLFPVIGNSEENEEFFKTTPSGSIELYLACDAGAKFELGEYYVEFTKA